MLNIQRLLKNKGDCPPCTKLQVCSLIPRKAGAVAYACNPSVQEVEAGGSDILVTSVILGYTVHSTEASLDYMTLSRDWGEKGKEREGREDRKERNKRTKTK